MVIKNKYNFFIELSAKRLFELEIILVKMLLLCNIFTNNNNIYKKKKIFPENSDKGFLF